MAIKNNPYGIDEDDLLDEEQQSALNSDPLATQGSQSAALPPSEPQFDIENPPAGGVSTGGGGGQSQPPQQQPQQPTTPPPVNPVEPTTPPVNPVEPTPSPGTEDPYYNLIPIGEGPKWGLPPGGGTNRPVVGADGRTYHLITTGDTGYWLTGADSLEDIWFSPPSDYAPDGKYWAINVAPTGGSFHPNQGTWYYIPGHGWVTAITAERVAEVGESYYDIPHYARSRETGEQIEIDPRLIPRGNQILYFNPYKPTLPPWVTSPGSPDPAWEDEWWAADEDKVYHVPGVGEVKGLNAAREAYQATQGNQAAQGGGGSGGAGAGNVYTPGQLNLSPSNIPAVPPPPPPPPGAPDFLSALEGLQPVQIPGMQPMPEVPGPTADFQALAQMGDWQAPGMQPLPETPAPGEAPNFMDTIAPYMDQGLYGDLTQFARDWLENYNPYASGLVAAERAASEGRIAEMERQRRNALGELISSRGLVGSSVEGQLHAGLQAQLAQQAREDEARLMDRLAQYELQGRQAAFSAATQAQQVGMEAARTALQAAGMSEEAMMNRARLALDAWRTGDEAQMERARLELDKIVQETAFALQAAGMASDEAMQRAQLALQGWMAQEEAQLRRSQLEMEDSLARAQMNLDALIAGDQAALDRVRLELDRWRAIEDATMTRAALEQRDREIQMEAWRLQEEFRLRGIELDINQAIALAELDIRRQQLAEDRKRNEFWEDLQILDFWERTQSGNRGARIPLGRAAEYGLPTSGYNDMLAADENGRIYRFQDGEWVPYSGHTSPGKMALTTRSDWRAFGLPDPERNGQEFVSPINNRRYRYRSEGQDGPGWYLQA